VVGAENSSVGLVGSAGAKFPPKSHIVHRNFLWSIEIATPGVLAQNRGFSPKIIFLKTFYRIFVRVQASEDVTVAMARIDACRKVVESVSGSVDVSHSGRGRRWDADGS